MKKWYFFIIVLIVGFIFSEDALNFVVLHRIKSLDLFFISLGNFWVDIVLLLLAIFFLFFKKNRIKWILSILFSLFFSLFLVFLLKNLFRIPRPLVEAIIVETGYAFPSGHATGSFSVIPTLFKNYGKIKYLFFILAILVSFSRVYVGVHSLTDVLVGALIGFLIGKLFVYLEEKHNLFKLIVMLFKKNVNR